jgi:hypothetical protein
LLSALVAVTRVEGTLRGHPGTVRLQQERLTGDTGYNGMTLMLNHVKAGETVSDDVVIGAIVDAYNKVHDGYKIVSAFKSEEMIVPEDGSDGGYFDSLGRYTVGWGT